jgi:hypothetical protein
VAVLRAISVLELVGAIERSSRRCAAVLVGGIEDPGENACDTFNEGNGSSNAFSLLI